MNFYRTADIQPREIAPGVQIRTLWGDRIMLSLVDLRPKAVVPAHFHPHEQMGFVLKGTIHLTIEEETRTLHTGDAYLIPPNEPHKVTVGEEQAQVVDLFSPPREEYKYP